MTLNIGTHPNNLATWILSQLPELQADLESVAGSVNWVRYEDGRETAPKLREGFIDVGATGSTPPIVAQASGDDIVYIGRSREHPERGGVVVPSQSPITTLGDLAGRSIAFTVGSWQTHAFAEVLARAELDPKDVRIIDIPAVASSRDVIDSGADAWLIHDPLLAAIDETLGETRIVASVAELVPNRSVFWANRAYAANNPEVIDTLITALDRAETWAAQNPGRVAELLTTSGRNDNARKWRDALGHRPWGVAGVDEAFLHEQQRAADLFHRYNVINSPVDVQRAVLA